MQLQFAKQEISCLHTLKREVQSQERTQEFRISDGMPDIGSIIGAWGQVILRSKEWQSDGMTVSGGTMVWVQYLPEEGGQPQCVESWLPFQMRWNLPETQHDGTIFTQCLLRSVDARSLSARKMMVRSNVSVLGWAMERGSKEWYEPENVPEDVQLLTKAYPMELPAEAGEKAFTLEESLTLPPSAPKLEKLTRYYLQPEITEEKLMGDKVVFRGNGLLHICYLAEDGGEYGWDFDLPFTQYGELEGEYGEDGESVLWPCVTALEMDSDDNSLTVKAGLVCQYRISHRPLVQVVEDAYSPRRSVEPIREDFKLPGILERKKQTVHIQKNSPMEGMRLVDVQFLPHPVYTRGGAGDVTLELPGQFQYLAVDMEGNLRTGMLNGEQSLTVPADEGTFVETVMWPAGKPQGTLISGMAQMSHDASVVSETISNTPIPMVTALELGELRQPDPMRPSLVLRRPEGKTLWELAKETGSTVSAIREANELQTEPDASRMLLIPVE